MKGTTQRKNAIPFPFVIEELRAIRPTIKRMFGFTYVYLDEKLLCSLRDSPKQAASNGMWLYTTTEHIESLGREFPQLSRRYLWRSGKNAWVILAAKLEHFEEYVFKACELILDRDRRVGRVTRGGISTQKKRLSLHDGSKRPPLLDSTFQKTEHDRS
ncbi:MAG: hypothetical protein WAV20_26305 [Blastocatellia bacterium]